VTGRALVGAGQAIGEFGQAIENELKRREDERDELSLIKGVNDFTAFTNDLRREIREKYRGGEAVGATAEFGKRLQEERDRLTKGMNQRVKNKFSLHSDKLMLDENAKIGDYESQEIREARKTAAEAGRTNKAESARGKAQTTSEDESKMTVAEREKKRLDEFSESVNPDNDLLSNGVPERKQQLDNDSKGMYAQGRMQDLLNDFANGRISIEEVEQAMSVLGNWLPYSQRNSITSQLNTMKNGRLVNEAVQGTIMQFEQAEGAGIDPNEYDKAKEFLKSWVGDQPWFNNADNALDAYISDQARKERTIRNRNDETVINTMSQLETWEQKTAYISQLPTKRGQDLANNMLKSEYASDANILMGITVDLAEDDYDTVIEKISAALQSGAITDPKVLQGLIDRKKQLDNSEAKKTWQQITKEFKPYIAKINDAKKKSDDLVTIEQNYLSRNLTVKKQKLLNTFNYLQEQALKSNIPEEKLREYFKELFTDATTLANQSAWETRLLEIQKSTAEEGFRKKQKEQAVIHKAKTDKNK